MIKLIRTDSTNADFIALVQKLDADLKEKDGNEHTFYAQYNKIDNIKNVVIAYSNSTPVGCGAVKHFNDQIMEVKRMFVEIPHRGNGIAGIILDELEKWTVELFYLKCILETGQKQVEAIRLYQKKGYSITPNYGQYIGIENSICFEKQLKF